MWYKPTPVPQRSQKRMADPIREYQDALRAHTAGRDEAKAIITYIADTASALQTYLPFFLFQSYGLSPIGDAPMNRPHLKPLPDINKWPDADKLQATLKAWHAALNKLHQTWNALPAND